MGTRLSVCDAVYKNLYFYGTKYYGYSGKAKDSKSFKYLISIGAVDKEIDPAFIEYFYEDGIQLTSDEFRKFIQLYSDDFREFGGDITECEHYPALLELMRTNNNKIVEWG